MATIPADTSTDPRLLLREEHHGMRFDGKVFSYIPQDGWRDRISPRIELHTDTAGDLDPVTYQVIRYALWNINEEHGTTIQKVSGSPVVVYGSDLNPTFLLEDGEYVFAGPFVQLMAGSADLYAQYLLEHYGDNPGIEEGDVFLGDDPWIAGYHQSDHYAMEAVFWEGKIFCWVVSTLHHQDSGGTLPGSFCIDAEHVFKEALPMPPFKIVERGELRQDLEDLFARRSRVPGLVRLDLRSQLAGLHVAKERTLALLKRYGAPVVKSAMRRIVADAEESFLRKMEQIPDGRWSVRNYVEAALPGDRGIYRIVLTLEKQGESLIFSSEGTDPQFGSHNCTWAGWRAYILPAVASTLAYDQLYAIGGALRHCVFVPNPGSTVNAKHPGAVGNAIVTLTVAAQAAQTVAKMLMASPLKRDLITPSALSGAAWPALGGVDQYGNVFATITPDMMAGGFGAFSFRDGSSTSGHFWNPRSTAANVEANELSYPMMYLYRRENNGGGAGRYTGGASIECAWVGHRTEGITVATVGSGIAVPTGLGTAGGLPAQTGSFRVIRNSRLAELMQRDGVLPRSIDDLGGDVQLTQPKEFGIVVGPSDVFAWSIMGGGSYGDPLERDAEAVARDVAGGRYDADYAGRIYGAVFAADGSIDAGATDERREWMRRERLSRASAPAGSANPAAGGKRRAFLEHLELAETADGDVYVCNRCEHVLGRAASPYKELCAVWETDLHAAGYGFADPAHFVDHRILWREFYCPGCGTMLENELAREGEELLDDARLADRRAS